MSRSMNCYGIFFPRKLVLVALLDLCAGGNRNQHFLLYVILFYASENRGDFQDHILSVFINRKTFLLSSQPRKPKQGRHHGVKQGGNPPSTNYFIYLFFCHLSNNIVTQNLSAKCRLNRAKQLCVNKSSFKIQNLPCCSPRGRSSFNNFFRVFFF